MPRFAETALDGRNSPPAPNVAFLLIALGRRATDDVEGRLRVLGLTYRTFAVLGHLAEQPGLSFTELARRSRVTMQSMHVTASALEVGGLVRRDRSGRGARARLQLTPLGQQRLADGLRAMRDTEQVILAAVPEPVRAQLTRTLLQVFLTGAVSETPEGDDGAGPS